MPIEILDAPGQPIYIVANNQYEKTWRAHPCAKEPETAKWIKNYVKPGDVFFDVGANIGAYGFMAAELGAKVFSFEPEAMNYGRLVQNIEINCSERHYGEKRHEWDITALNFALWDRKGIEKMWMRMAVPGAADHVIAEENPDKEIYLASQDLFLIPMDELEHWGIPFPTHIKIDVDGGEARVLWGAMGFLLYPQLKTVMVEIDHSREGVLGHIEQVMASSMFVEKERWRRTLEVHNHLFVKEGAL